MRLMGGVRASGAAGGLPPCARPKAPTWQAAPPAPPHLCSSLMTLAMRLYSFSLNHSPHSFRLVLNHSLRRGGGGVKGVEFYL